jgi:hypothetical protein
LSLFPGLSLVLGLPRDTMPRAKPLSDHGMSRPATLNAGGEKATPHGKPPTNCSTNASPHRLAPMLMTFPTSETVRSTATRLEVLPCEQFKGRCATRTAKIRNPAKQEACVRFCPFFLTFNSFDHLLALRLRPFRCSR